jgi:hypothetical protein
MQPLCNSILVLALLVNVLNVPIAMRPTSGLLDQRFPCEKRGCGCHVERCWTTCSCTTIAEKLEWSVREGIQPPTAFLERLEISVATWRNWTTRGLADRSVAQDIARAVPQRTAQASASCCGCSSAPISCCSETPAASHDVPDSVHATLAEPLHGCGTEPTGGACVPVMTSDRSGRSLATKPMAWDTFRCGTPADEVVLLFGETFVAIYRGLDQPMEFADWIASSAAILAAIAFPPPTPPPRLFFF